MDFKVTAWSLGSPWLGMYVVVHAVQGMEGGSYSTKTSGIRAFQVRETSKGR